jgi:hypothetical protein
MKEADKQSGNMAVCFVPHKLRSKYAAALSSRCSLNSGMRSASLALFSGKHRGQQVYHDNFLFDLRSLLLT